MTERRQSRPHRLTGWTKLTGRVRGHGRTPRVACAAAVLALGLAACSVPQDVEARRIASDAIPQFLQNQVKQRTIYLLRGPRLTRCSCRCR